MKGRLLNAYAICPTYAYFKLHYPEPPTPSMEFGKELDVREVVEEHIKTKCRVSYQVPLSGSLGTGRVDALIECADRVEVVEVKLSEGFLRPQLLQAAFYCILAEEALGKPCRALWLCSPSRCIRKNFTEGLRISVIGMVESLEEDLKTMPRGRPSGYCSYCKYAGICPWKRG
ncbi:MAG: CRISPR-associated protein Cas4 [Crenarchaeota archaeon]|nr:CRISPR-associated protein Cas4 [Thermoproteota archaeon]